MKRDVNEEYISSVEAKEACKRILESDRFVNAPRMCRLLQYLVDNAIEGNTGNTSEYAIGISVFDRDASKYCTAEDPAVRVQVGRLREKLKEYYAATTSNIEISIPLGSYMPVFRRAAGAGCKYAPSLYLRTIRCITECDDGKTFAQGLQEELMHQLYRSFERLSILRAVGDEVASANRTCDKGARHVIEGCVRIDSNRIRASVHLLDCEYGNVTWSEQFDRDNRCDITLQEELAFSICKALKQHMVDNMLY